MQFTIPMSVTVEVHQETAVLLAAGARALGEPWAREDDRAEAAATAMSSLIGALTELIEPAAVFERVYGLEVLSSTVELPIKYTDD